MMKKNTHVLGIYYQHWGMEQNQRRHDRYQKRLVRDLMSRFFTFSVIEMDYDPRPSTKPGWGRLSLDADDFWDHLRFVSSTLTDFPTDTKKDSNQVFRRMESLSNLLFDPVTPLRMPRENIGTPWEHAYRRKRQLCRLNAISESALVHQSTCVLERVNALIALPPLLF
jgi:hypothetical protein